MLYDRMDSTRKSSLTLVFLLAFFIIASDMGMKSEAQISPLARCSKDSDCKRYCPTCYQCNCVRRVCLCENSPPLANNIHSQAPPY
ncbi:hypothetical protein GLYMA_11G159100v4 [Glycine max]|nr:hypothetical protein GLYMA_11G159100v4 [Glycine max]KAH1159657.1 hypothetical protein GYH30_031393 [Glycine max]